MFHKFRTTWAVNTNRLSQQKMKFMGGIFLLTSIPLSCQGMDIAYSFISAVAAPVASLGASYIPDSIKNTVNEYANTICGEAKDFESLFMEFTANRMESDLKDLVENYKICYESKATDISNHKRHVDSFDFNINEVTQSAEMTRTYLLRYSLAILTLDYTHQCKTLLEQSIKNIEGIKIKFEEWVLLGDSSENQKKGDAQLIINYLNKIKLNLGSALYAKYQYVRKGGLVDRGTTSYTAQRKRYKYWGVYELPKMGLTSPSDEINAILKSKSQISKLIGPTIDIYNTTMEFLKEPEINIIQSDDPYKMLEVYKNQYRTLFAKEPSEEKLYSPLVLEYNRVRNDIINQNRGGLVTPMIPTPSVPIPRQNSAKLKKANSQSFGAPSSLPVNFRAAMDAHNDVASAIKAQSPLRHSPSKITAASLETKPILLASIPKVGFANIVESYEQSKSTEYSGENSDSYTSSEDTQSGDSND